MASVPVEDAGVGSAVNDVSRELGSALGVAILGSVISSIYRSNVDAELTGNVPDEVVEVAQEGLGVLAATSGSLPPETAAAAFDGSSAAFIDAMSTGFWLSAGVLGIGAVVAAWLLPNEIRTDQVEREGQPDRDSDDEIDLLFPELV
jgi:hypothetical protein